MPEEDNINQYCEAIIRSPLPFICRRTLVKMIMFVYILVQAYTCHKLRVYRHEKMEQVKTLLKEAEVHLANSSALFNGTIIGQQDAVSTLSILNATDGNATANNSSGPVFDDKFYIEPLVGSASSAFFMLFAFFLCFVVSYARDQSMYQCAVLYCNLIQLKTVRQYREDRANYRQKHRKLDELSEDVLKLVLTFRERSSVLRFCETVRLCWKPKTSLVKFVYPSVDCTLVDYMHSDLNVKRGFQVLGAIDILHEVMKGMDFLHYRNSYHLDLRSESVKLHCNGHRVYVKLTNFNYMKKSVDKKVHSDSVGLKEFYRPPECAAEQEVDAEKCDIWGLGMIALDLFTGGLYRIRTESKEFSEQGREDLIDSFLQCSSFCAGVEATYGILHMFVHARFHSKTKFAYRTEGQKRRVVAVPRYPYKSYKMSHAKFLYHLRSFVRRLLVTSPRRRITLQRAFAEPLIKRRKGSPN